MWKNVDVDVLHLDVLNVDVSCWYVAKAAMFHAVVDHPLGEILYIQINMYGYICVYI